MGIWEWKIKGAYINSKHRVGEESNSVGNYYTGKYGQCYEEKMGTGPDTVYCRVPAPGEYGLSLCIW